MSVAVPALLDALPAFSAADATSPVGVKRFFGDARLADSNPRPRDGERRDPLRGTLPRGTRRAATRGATTRSPLETRASAAGSGPRRGGGTPMLVARTVFSPTTSVEFACGRLRDAARRASRAAGEAGEAGVFAALEAMVASGGGEGGSRGRRRRRAS